jgi:DNA-binding winged helix-turn-helix (wHTH) protein
VIREASDWKRYRFGEFTLCPRQRVLLHGGRPVPLIPRYFDLLVTLVERRHEALHRREIFDAVWSDVVVSDGALSQAIRSLRRALGDDAGETGFIRTVSRHGYQFVQEVVEEADPAADRPLAPESWQAPVDQPEGGPRPASEDPFEAPIATLLSARSANGDDAVREAAEVLHTLGTAEALRRIDRRPGHEIARAVLRDSRWDVAGAGRVPLLGQAGGLRAAFHLIRLRLRRAFRLAGNRWLFASAGGALAGAVAGSLGGMVLRSAPGCQASPTLPLSLAIVGGAIGGLGAAGVGFGLAAAEALARSLRGFALMTLGGLGGAAAGGLAYAVVRTVLGGVFGRDLSELGGVAEGLALGAAAGLGYGLATPMLGGGGMAAPRGPRRIGAAVLTGLVCAVAAILLTAFHRNLVGASLDLIARSFPGSQASLVPLGALLGETGFGPWARASLAAWEGFFFGAGLSFGLTHRPHPEPD